MSYTESTLMALGTTAPPFSLLNVETNAFLSLDELTSEKATLIMFICKSLPLRQIHQYTARRPGKNISGKGGFCHCN